MATIPKRKEWRCRECGWQFSVKVGTIFESSPIGFDKWLPALWPLTANRNGVSSHELGRSLGVTQKTAWFMLYRLRLALKDREQQPFGGAVEAETYIGGKQRATATTPLGHKELAHGPADGKTTVFGMLERIEDKKAKPSRVRAIVIADRKSATLPPAIHENVLPGSVLYTDAWQAYRGAQRDYTHFYIDHAVKYVEGHVTTNRIENFRSCLKRTLHGAYICRTPSTFRRTWTSKSTASTCGRSRTGRGSWAG